MQEKNVHFRHILLFYFKKGKRVAEAHKKICNVYGDDALTERVCRKWFAKFRSGDFDVSDATHSGRPAEIDSAVKNTVDKNPSQMVREIATTLNMSYTIVENHLRQLGYKNTERSYLPTQYDPQTKRKSATCKSPGSPKSKKLRFQKSREKTMFTLGADPNIADHYGQTSLHRAVKSPEAEGSIDVLLAEKEINIEANMDLGWTPLQLAAKAGSYYEVRSLVRAGADVNNIEVTYGKTALHIAVEGGHKNIVEFLLKNTKIDVNKRNFSGNTALHTATVIPGTKAKETCALLLKYGADQHIRNYNRESSVNVGEQMEGIKTDVHSDENPEECTGQSSLDLASNKPDILQFVSDRSGMLVPRVDNAIKEENIDDTQKVWMDADQEKQLASILDETKGWKKLAHHFNFNYLLNVFEQSSSSSTLPLLNFIAIQTHTSLSELRSILQEIGENGAATYIDQIFL